VSAVAERLVGFHTVPAIVPSAARVGINKEITMAVRQYGNPMLIENDIEKRLERVRADELGKSEDWLQELLFKHPGLLPIDEIEPAFSGPVSVARELRTRSGPVDLLCVNGRGHITLIETKLWKNPEDRRMVVGQIIDYAAQIAKWSYSDLVSAVRTATGSPEADPLMAAVETGIELGARAGAESGATCCQRIAPFGATSNTLLSILTS
jgi:hypothetical protein